MDSLIALLLVLFVLGVRVTVIPIDHFSFVVTIFAVVVVVEDDNAFIVIAVDVDNEYNKI